MDTNDLNIFFNSVSFTQDADGFYAGIGQNSIDGILFQIAVLDDKICCFKNSLLLFQIPKVVSLGTFIVLCQDFGIIHERYIYENVEAIETSFYENNEDDEIFDEDLDGGEEIDDDDDFFVLDEEDYDPIKDSTNMAYNKLDYLKTTKFMKLLNNKVKTRN